jgi:hypothetical protein
VLLEHHRQKGIVMSTFSPTARSATGVTVRGTVAAGLAGAVVFGLAMAAGVVFDLNADGRDGDASFDWNELWFYVVSPLVAVALAAWLGRRALAGTPQRLARTALGLGIAAAATVVVFWTGWPLVFGAVAALLGLEHRRRLGSFAPVAVAAIGLGTVALLVSAVVCVTG